VTRQANALLVILVDELPFFWLVLQQHPGFS
jgi:hypothetical protein